MNTLTITERFTPDTVGVHTDIVRVGFGGTVGFEEGTLGGFGGVRIGR
jgi:hypothetical protein